MKIDSNVVVLGGKEAAEAKRKQDLLDVIDAMRMSAHMSAKQGAVCPAPE